MTAPGVDANLVALTASDYARYSNEHPDATVFHGTAWLETISMTYGLVVRYLCLRRGDEVLGVCALIERRLLGLPLIGAPLPGIATHHLHPLLEPDAAPIFLAAFARWAASHRLPHVQLDWPPRPLPPIPSEFHSETRGTLQVRLDRPLSEIWQGIKREARNRIRYAIRHRVRLHWRTDAAFSDIYLTMLRSTYARQTRPIRFPPDLHEALLEQLGGRGLQVLVATVDNQPIAALWLLHDRQRCYFWDGASLQEHRQLSANNLLHWAAMRWAKRRGLALYDMVGDGAAREGIGTFKRSLGAEAATIQVLYRQWPAVRLALRAWRTLAQARHSHCSR